eukprot:6852738-Prymnesium_polylepis.3
MAGLAFAATREAQRRARGRGAGRHVVLVGRGRQTRPGSVEVERSRSIGDDRGPRGQPRVLAPAIIGGFISLRAARLAGEEPIDPQLLLCRAVDGHRLVRQLDRLELLAVRLCIHASIERSRSDSVPTSGWWSDPNCCCGLVLVQLMPLRSHSSSLCATSEQWFLRAQLDALQREDEAASTEGVGSVQHLVDGQIGGDGAVGREQVPHAEDARKQLLVGQVLVEGVPRLEEEVVERLRKVDKAVAEDGHACSRLAGGKLVAIDVAVEANLLAAVLEQLGELRAVERRHVRDVAEPEGCAN